MDHIDDPPELDEDELDDELDEYEVMDSRRRLCLRTRLESLEEYEDEWIRRHAIAWLVADAIRGEVSASSWEEAVDSLWHHATRSTGGLVDLVYLYDFRYGLEYVTGDDTGWNIVELWRDDDGNPEISSEDEISEVMSDAPGWLASESAAWLRTAREAAAVERKRYVHAVDEYRATQKMKLWWAQTADHGEDWFILARDAAEAEDFHWEAEGYNPGEAWAIHVADAPDSLTNVGWPQDGDLAACGGVFTGKVSSPDPVLRDMMGIPDDAWRFGDRVYVPGDLVTNVIAAMTTSEDKH